MQNVIIRFGRGIRAAGLTGTLLSVIVGVGSAAGNIGNGPPRYPGVTLRSCGGTAADPINVIFRGRDSTADEVSALVEHVGVFWGQHDIIGGGVQYVSFAGCRRQDHQNSLGFFNKHHARVFQLPGQQNGDYVSVLDAHRDIKRSGCGFNDTVPRRMSYHGAMISGYDYAQAEFVDGFSSGTRVVSYRAQRGPRHMTFRQCNPYHKGKRDQYHQVGWSGGVDVYGF